MSQTTETAAPRTRAVVFVLITAFTGVFFDIFYGPAESELTGSTLPVMGLVGVAAGAAAALMLCSMIGAVAERRGRRSYYRESR